MIPRRFLRNHISISIAAVSLTYAAIPSATAWTLISVDINKSGAAATTQSGAAVLGTVGDTWNGINQNGSSAGLLDSTNVPTAVTLSTISGLSSYLGGGGNNAGGTTMDAATTDLMRDYAYSDAAGAGSKLTFTLGGLAPSTSYQFVLYAAGDATGQGATITINGVSWGATTGANRQLTSGNGVAYHSATATTNASGQLIVESTALGGSYGNPSINGFQIQDLTAPPTAADGIWTSTADGDWTLAANWQDGASAYGTDKTATFHGSTGVTVTLDSSRIIGNLSFDNADYTIAGSLALALSRTSGTPTVTVGDTGGAHTTTIAAPLTGAGGLEKAGNGSLVLTGTNLYSGTTTISAGTLQIGSGGTTGNLGNGSVINSGILEINRSNNYGTGTTQAFSGSGSLVKKGAGNLVFNGAGFHTNAQGIATMTLDGGITRTDNYGLLNSNLALTINPAGTLEMWSTNHTIGTLSGSGTVINSANFNGYLGGPAANATTLTIGNGDISSTFSGIITDTQNGSNGNSLNLTKTGTGTFTLSGINTYTGNTTINDGFLVLADDAQLKFLPRASSVTNSVIGTGGTAQLNGDFLIDTSLANITDGNLWVLVDVNNLVNPFGGTFSVIGFTKSGTTWTKVDGSNTWTFSEETGELMLAVASDPFASWISPFGVADPSAEGDPDFDGICNLVEYVLQNGDPSLPSTGILPSANASGSDLVFTLFRRNASTADSTQIFQYGSDLTGWTSVALVNGGQVSITPETPAAGIDQIIVTIPKDSNTRLFGRLKVTKP